jgi:hypothetical protein
MEGLHHPRKSHLLFVCFIATQILVWSILVGHAAYSWGVLFHHPELHIKCFLCSKMLCPRMYVVCNHAPSPSLLVVHINFQERGVLV